MQKSTEEQIRKSVEEQMLKAFYDKLREDFNHEPPKTDHIRKLLEEIYTKLCQFVPSKKKIHDAIKLDIIINEITINTMPILVISLINWIEKFQAPVYDKKTREWREQLKKCENCTEFLIYFLKEYYSHLELVHKEVYEYRLKLANNQNIFTQNKINNIGEIKMKTGK